MSKAIIFWLAILLLFSGVAVVWSALRLVQNQNETQPTGVVVLDQAPKGVDWLKDFRLTERSGKKVSSEDLKGGVWLASFFYSSCPGTCRQQNLEIMALQNKYAKRGMKFVSITCDPRTDTLPKLREYAESFQAKPDSWYFLTGDIRYVQRIGAEFFQVAVREAGHSDRFMLVDKWGNVRAHIDWTNPIARLEMHKIIEQLLAEQSPPEQVTLVVPGTMPPLPADAEEEEDAEQSLGDDAAADTSASEDEPAEEEATEHEPAEATN